MGMAAESQFHVLAVDDSLFDRKYIERLLQKSSCQGIMSVNTKKKSQSLFEKIEERSKLFYVFGICSNYC